jgi:hypothetical protein
MRTARWLAMAVTTALLFAACNSGGSKKRTTAATSTTSTTSATAVTGKALSPEPESVQGVGGVGIVVDLVFRTKDPSLLTAEVRSGGGAKPGANPAFPGLVVSLSTTDPSLGGPSANLADLFQIVSVSKQSDGSSEVWATWVNAKPLFGVDVDSVLEAYVVHGGAPPIAPTDHVGLDVVSNVLRVSFHVAGGVAPSSSTSSSLVVSSTTARRTTTTARRVTTTPTTKPAATTTASTAPPAPPTTPTSH